MTVERKANVIVARWSPEPADLRVYLTRPSFRRQRAKAMVVATVLFVAGVLIAVTPSSRAVGIAVAIWGGTLLLLMSLLYRRSLQLRWRSDPLLRDPVEYTFDDEGVVRRQTDFECRWGWARIRGVEETPGAFILRLGDGRASDGLTLLIAKRGIANPTDETQLRAMLESHPRRG